MVTATGNRIDTHVAKKILRNAFAKNPKPSEEELERIAEQCGRPAYAVSKWFEKEREKLRSSQQITRTSSFVGSDVFNTNLRPTGAAKSKSQETNGGTTDPDDQWDQYPPPRAEDEPDVAFGNNLKHELDCALALFLLAKSGKPMTFSSEPR